MLLVEGDLRGAEAREALAQRVGDRVGALAPRERRKLGRELRARGELGARAPKLANELLRFAKSIYLGRLKGWRRVVSWLLLN